MAYMCTRIPNLECNCCGICSDTKIPHCPICDEECENFYKDNTGEILGCENCIDEVESYAESED